MQSAFTRPEALQLQRTLYQPPISLASLRVMAESSQKHVVVIGGGIVGSSTAYFLKKRGANVTIVEGSSIAAGASGKAGGLLAYDWTEGQPTESLQVLR